MKQEKCISWNPLTLKLQWHSWQSFLRRGNKMYCSKKNIRDTYQSYDTHTKKTINMQKGQNQINQRKDKIRGLFSWQHCAPASCAFISFFFFPLPLLPFVTRLSYRHEVKEWGRQCGNTLYHEERDAGSPRHGVHQARTLLWPHIGKHTQRNTHDTWVVYVVHIYRTIHEHTSKWYDCILLRIDTCTRALSG